ncbi:hypothetical protein [Hymenobacter sp. AT01-02]|uniref:hypothetical protein n=1 Tax=Hymenobacter sp. AT01-02 TaxID=1571877 RepID=UPI00128ED8E6|nr:hypothetical protein [Hymenobacter sp. AT01-02]
MKGTNTIVIQTTDSANVALKEIARSMVLAGYSVKSLDNDLGYMVIEHNIVGGGITTNNTAFVFKAVASPAVAGTLLTLTGDAEIVYNNVNRMTEHMFWAKSNLTWGKQCFTVAEEIAKGYQGAQIGYKTIKR